MFGCIWRKANSHTRTVERRLRVKEAKTDQEVTRRNLRPAMLLQGSVVKESESEGAQSCLTLCDPMDCSLPGSSMHGIFQARVQEWVAIAFSRGSS